MERFASGQPSIAPLEVSSYDAAVGDAAGVVRGHDRVCRPTVDAGQANRHGCAFAWCAGNADAALMFSTIFFHDRGETEAGAGTLRGKERLENLVDMFGRDRCPVILIRIWTSRCLPARWLPW